jgi:hypothetical protein
MNNCPYHDELVLADPAGFEVAVRRLVETTCEQWLVSRVATLQTMDSPPPSRSASSVKDWMFNEVRRRQAAGNIPREASRFARQLALQMAKDVRAGKCARALPASSIRPRLYDNKLWPLE